MTKKDFLDSVNNEAVVAINRANAFLKTIGLGVEINWDYDEWGYNDLENAIGVYESGSVFSGTISIGFNVDNLYKSFKWSCKDNPWSDPFTILREMIATNVYHETGHGICEQIDDYLRETDELDDLYDQNKNFWDNIFDNEEDAVEEFAWCFYDNELKNSRLYKLIKLVYNTLNNENLYEAKKGGMNYANNGDSFYTRQKDIANELGHYNLKGMVVYCNCDNPSMSQFYIYLKTCFEKIGLRGLYATYFDENPYAYFYDGHSEKKWRINSGRFQDNAEIMKRCDVVITNPPFSSGMSIELVKMAKKYGKHIIIVAPLTVAYNKDTFNMIKNNELNAGYTGINRFVMPDGSKKNASTMWWTTMPVQKGFIKTGKKYTPEEYPTYDNIDAIEVNDAVKNMPDDYNGYMGVSPRFLRYLNRDQFDIVSKERPILNGKGGFERIIIKRKQ